MKTTLCISVTSSVSRSRTVDKMIMTNYRIMLPQLGASWVGALLLIMSFPRFFSKYVSRHGCTRGFPSTFMPVDVLLIRAFPSAPNVRLPVLTMAKGNPPTGYCLSAFLGERNKCSECLLKGRLIYAAVFRGIVLQQRQKCFLPLPRGKKRL